MCGIAGYLTVSATRPPLGAMVETLRRRGPDRHGTWARGGAGVGAARLRITGGDEADQPVATPAGGAFVMNGEIYDWAAIAARLGVDTASDTVTAAALVERDGPAALGAVRGAFAAAWASAAGDRVVVVRDHFGQKPLYWIDTGEAVLFASEVRALLAAGVRAEVDDESLADLIALQFLRPERTLFRGVRVLPPGGVLELSVTSSGLRVERSRLELPACDDVRSALEEAISLQGRRTVPAGIALSGGLDSSAVAGGLSACGSPPDGAWVGAFPEDAACDERPHARAAAEELGLPLHEVLIDADRYRAAMDDTVRALEMPVAGPGSVAQFIVAEEASREVRVLFGGQGGDEVFGGYERFRILQALADGDTSPVEVSYRPLLARMERAWLTRRDLRDAYLAGIGRAGRLDAALGGRIAPDDLVAARERFRGLLGRSPCDVDALARFEWRVQLPGLLHVDDRTTAWHALESRAPLLDQRVVAAASARPLAEKSPSEEPRRLFRAVCGNIIPRAVRRRTDKMGFPLPLRRWVAGPWRDWAHDLLGSQRSRERGIVRADSVTSLLSDDGSAGRAIFALLMLELWHRAFIDGGTTRGDVPAGRAVAGGETYA